MRIRQTGLGFAHLHLRLEQIGLLLKLGCHTRILGIHHRVERHAQAILVIHVVVRFGRQARILRGRFRLGIAQCGQAIGRCLVGLQRRQRGGGFGQRALGI